MFPKTFRALAASAALTVFLASAAGAQAAFPTASIRGSAYIPMAGLEASGLRCEWDPVLKNLTVTGAAGTARFHVGSEYVLGRGSLEKLSDKVRFYQGDVFLPASASRVLESLTEEGASAPAPPAETPVPATVHVSAPAAPASERRAATAVRVPHKIVIDAGHGAHDSGALGFYSLQEKTIVLDIARQVARELESRGFDVVMTRDTDVFIPLERRALIANAARADLFVSIHANASTTHALRGFEVYSLSEEADDDSLAAQRAEMSAPFFRTADASASNGLKAVLWDLRQAENRRESIRVAQIIAGEASGASLAATRRLKSAQFYVLKWTECPAVLVETGYVTNSQDARLLRSPYYRQRMAQAIARSLVRYRDEFARTEGFTR